MNNSRIIYDHVCAKLTGGVTFTLDLKVCTGMDSTFMGTLLVMHDEVEAKGASVRVVNVGELLREKLAELGVLGLIRVEDEAVQLEEIEWEEFGSKSDSASSEDERMNLILESHEKLASKSASNENRFRSFLSSLRIGTRGPKK